MAITSPLVPKSDGWGSDRQEQGTCAGGGMLCWNGKTIPVSLEERVLSLSLPPSADTSLLSALVELGSLGFSRLVIVLEPGMHPGHLLSLGFYLIDRHVLALELD